MSKKNVYQLNYSFEAPDIKKSELTGKAITEHFEEGELLIGDDYKNNYIIVDERYLFPMEYVEKTEKFPYLKKDSSFDETIDRIKQQSVLLSEREAERLDDLGYNIKSTIEGRKAKEMKSEASSYKRGAVLGLACGIISALYFKKNILVFSVLGVAIGGYVSHKLYIAKKGNNNVEPIQ
jgi:uncharacterized membrane protein